MSSGILFDAKYTLATASSTKRVTSGVAGSDTTILFPKGKLISPHCLELFGTDMSLSCLTI